MPALPAAGAVPRRGHGRASRRITVRRWRRSATARPRLLVVGLAPGFHGANATGRPFTGDHAGILLYETLHRVRLGERARVAFARRRARARRAAASRTRSSACRRRTSRRPPRSRPATRSWPRNSAALDPGAVILALGAIAHGAVLRGCGLKASACVFGHGAEHALPGGRVLVDSYHCSRYNTQTRRLTTEMFREVVGRATARARRL